MDKVYLVHNKYYDYSERAGGSMLLGIYASMESALSARKEFYRAELAECEKMDWPASGYFDADNNPAIDKFFNGELVEGNIYTIEEWCVSP